LGPSPESDSPARGPGGIRHSSLTRSLAALARASVTVSVTVARVVTWQHDIGPTPPPRPALAVSEPGAELDSEVQGSESLSRPPCHWQTVRLRMPAPGPGPGPYGSRGLSGRPEWAGDSERASLECRGRGPWWALPAARRRPHLT
jgi:hypothetical protein